MFSRTIFRFLPVAALGLTSLTAVIAQEASAPQTGYVDVNGLHMYYEIHGSGEPLIVLHGAYMSIPIMGDLVPRLAETRQVIAVELQGHGRTADIDRPFSYDGMADDMAAFMDEIDIVKADIFGYSLGGGIALQMALRHPEKVDRLVLASTGYSSEAYYPGFYDMLDHMGPELFEGTPVIDDYRALSPKPDFARLVEKMVALDREVFAWSKDDIQAITSPTFIIAGDSDSVRPEHSLDLFHLRGGGVDGDLAGLPNARLAILPATSHIGVLFRVDWLVPMITEFLDTPLTQ